MENPFVMETIFSIFNNIRVGLPFHAPPTPPPPPSCASVIVAEYALISLNMPKYH